MYGIVTRFESHFTQVSGFLAFCSRHLRTEQNVLKWMRISFDFVNSLAETTFM